MLLKQEVNKLHTFRKRETYKSLEGPFPKMWKQKRVTGEDTLTSNATKKRLSYTWGWLQGMQRTPGFCSSHESFYNHSIILSFQVGSSVMQLLLNSPCS